MHRALADEPVLRWIPFGLALLCMSHLLKCSMGKKSYLVYFSLSKALNTVSHMILTAKLVSEQGKGTVRWVEKWPDCQGQRLHQQNKVQLEAGYWCLSQGLKPALLKVFINDLDDRMECTLQVRGQKGTAVGQVYLIFWLSGCLQRDLNRLYKGTG